MTVITYNDKKIFRLPKSKSPEINSVFFMSVHKSGSTLLNNMVRDLCEILEYEYTDIQSFYFNKGIPDRSIPTCTEKIFKKKGYVYSGFRYFPHQYEIPCFYECPLVVLIRDPRDAVVSQYYSLAKSHPLPGIGLDKSLRGHMLKKREEVAGTDIDEFCLKNIGGFVKKIRTYQELIKTHPNVKLFQYEEVIYMKKKWIKTMLRFLGWKLKPGQPLRLAAKHNVLPVSEQESSHIRQVHPQNHVHKLRPETVRKMNKMHKDVLIAYNYI